MCCSTSAVQGLKPVMMMLVVQTAYVVMNIFYKLVAEVGTNFTILIAYRNLFSAALMLPLALTFERKSRPKLTLDILVHGFISGLLGATLTQNFYIESLALTSATYVVACSNLVPVITFIIALCFRYLYTEVIKIERLALGTHTGRAKVVGTLFCIGGTMLFTFYKGKHIGIWSTHVNLLRNYSHENSRVASLHRHTRTQSLGSFLALCSSTSFASWLIFQTKMTKKYPCQYSSTALMSVMASIQSVAFALCKERDWSQWKLGWDIKLFTAVILGGTLIVCGLYMVLWGKSKEMKMMTQQTQQPPLEDQSHSIDIALTSPVNSAATCDIDDLSISTPPINGLKENVEH
ncbi:hypothetical protein DVH24_033289 [Malus domestica]|uniref:WAT1-related protein n=1 Tax=Malus domestica TaxID=3750 RepID=A0A498JEY8_MALDO|nr:hypothetical protein DVH24_033289 [Malus domestica]